MHKTLRLRGQWAQESRDEDGGVTMMSCPWRSRWNGLSQVLLSLEQKSQLRNSSCVWERPRILMRNSRGALVGWCHPVAWEFYVIFAENDKDKSEMCWLDHWEYLLWFLWAVRTHWGWMWNDFVKGTGLERWHLEGWYLEEPGSPVFSTNFLTIYKQMDPIFTSFLHS